jgi:uncharacterized protein involved in outer membrane biogenesis
MIKKIAIVLVVIFALFLVFRDLMIKQIIISVGSSVVGAPLKVGGFSLSLLTSQVHLSDVKLYNPSGFSDYPLIDIAHIRVHYLPIALATGKMYFSLIDLDVRQLMIEKNQEKKYNVSSLKVNPQQSDKKGESSSSKPLDMRIDTLKLNVDRVTLREYAKDGQLKETDRGIGLNRKEFRNITSPQQLAALVLFESSGLGQLKDIGMVVTKDILKDVGHLGKDVTGDAKKTVNSLVGSLKSVVNK